VQGYDCVSTGTQAMPPSWTNVTDPNVAFDTKGRVYQATLPFNAFWGNATLHPDGAIDVSYSDDMGQHWVKGNGGQDLEQSPNSSAKQDWDGTQMDVKFTQPTDDGTTWSKPVTVNDNVDAAGVPTDQFQPSVAAGPAGAVAVAFYDRRPPCPNGPSILPADVGKTNFCIDVSLQAYKDTGSGAVPAEGNVRISKFSWDPQRPGQTVGGLRQLPCADATCAVGFIATSSAWRSPAATSMHCSYRLTIHPM
jgi:hypothetical protein